MDASQLIGRLVDDRYKIMEGMASGSMGAVYKAERVPVGKLVAIKFLHAAFATDAEFLTRFERETRVMSKLAHPNCVSVVDFGVYEGAPYLVMDYVAGKTLRSLIDDAPLGPMRALLLVRQIVAGLAHAHAQGVVHRDIKPANIMISEEIGAGEHARILDFGLARLRGAVGGRDATQHNMVVGTPNYMAPEQTVGGGTIDARTDVYALGVVLFEMIAGERPFQAEDTLALLGMHRAAPIPKLADRLDRTIVLPNGVQQVLEKAMAKSPEDRYQTAIEFAEAIDEITGAKTQPEPKGEVVHRKRVATPLAGSSIVRAGGTRDDAAVASTMLDTTTAKVPPKKSSNTMAGFVFALIVLLGGAATAWYLFGRPSQQATPADAALARLHDAPTGPGSAGSNGSTGSAGSAITGSGSAIDSAGSGSAVAEGSGSGSAEVGSGSAVAAGSGSGSDVGSGSGAGSGSGEIEMEPDPETATNVAPKTAESEAEDEAPNAPITETEVEKHAPPTPMKAATIRDALVLIKEGKSELAISSLRALWKKAPKNGYIPFLLGNLYFDKRWWSIAMDHYRIAIVKNGGYRQNSTLNRNIIRMLASNKTRGKADYFLRKTIGKPAVPYLKFAAQSEKNARVRSYAAGLAKAIGGR
jgi:serine/threonine-protein kinase